MINFIVQWIIVMVITPNIHNQDKFNIDDYRIVVDMCYQEFELDSAGAYALYEEGKNIVLLNNANIHSSYASCMKMDSRIDSTVKIPENEYWISIDSILIK